MQEDIFMNMALLAECCDAEGLLVEADHIHSILRQASTKPGMLRAAIYGPQQNLNVDVSDDKDGPRMWHWLSDQDDNGNNVQEQRIEKLYNQPQFEPAETQSPPLDDDDTGADEKGNMSPMQMNADGKPMGFANVSPLSTPSMRIRGLEDMQTMDEQRSEQAPYAKNMLS